MQIIQKIACSQLLQDACRLFQNVIECMQNVPECSRMHAKCPRMHAESYKMFLNACRSMSIHAIVTYERRCAQADAGLAPLHRHRGWQREERRQAKAIALNCWYRPQNTLSASYLQTTLTQSSPKSFWSLLTSC